MSIVKRHFLKGHRHMLIPSRQRYQNHHNEFFTLKGGLSKIRVKCCHSEILRSIFVISYPFNNRSDPTPTYFSCKLSMNFPNA